MTAPAEVVELGPDDTEEIAELIASVFADQIAITRWLVPDNDKLRTSLLRQQFILLITGAFKSGGRVDGIRVDAKLDAAAVWSMHPGGEVTDPPGYDAKLRQITGDLYPRFRALDDVFQRTTPDSPHDHLDLLAARTRRQGHGTTLVTHHLRRVDQQPNGSLVTLHASSTQAAWLYHRLDFESDEPVQIPDSDEQFIYPMRRHPRGPMPRRSRRGVHIV
ncbi:hypothetical protein ABJI51_16715 [Amycolatopsis sp. NEAU-NG30]|uniref:N-acetyltransferase domain-containing protein n=1 Tax=Amycolatopsis melonis TaxID=3156488 RepID=A0ABV0LEK1_9PSEU